MERKNDQHESPLAGHPEESLVGSPCRDTENPLLWIHDPLKIGLLFDCMSELIWMADLKGGILFANEAARRASGILHGQEDRHTMYSILSEKYRDQARKAMASVFEQGSWQGALQFHNADTGGLTDAHSKVLLMRNHLTGAACLATISVDTSGHTGREKEPGEQRGEQKHPAGIRPSRKEAGNAALKDEIEQRKKAEQALTDNLEQFRLIMETIGEVLWLADPDLSTLHYVSPRYEELWGRSLDSLYKNPMSFMDAIAEPDRLPVLAFYRQKEKGKPFAHEYRIKRPDGAMRWISARKYPIFNDRGALVYYVGAARDITVQKEMEEEIRHHHECLQRLVEERTEDLARINSRLRKEITVRKDSEHALKIREKELEEMNTALKVLLKQRAADQADIEKSILANVKESVLPYLDRLKGTTLGDSQRQLVAVIEKTLEEVTSPFIKEISSGLIGLSPSEIQVATLIKEGKSSKEIAQILGISHYTVMSCRYSIRTKTRVKGKKVNLRAFLQTLK